MAESRRSSRAKKEVDYSTFAGGDDSDDGDFTDPTPPPAKKLKEEKTKKTKKKRSSRDIDDDYDEFKETTRGKRKDRKPVEDRMFDRELELAMEMSRQESSQEGNDSVYSAPKRKAKEVSAMVHTAAEPKIAESDDDDDSLPMPVLAHQEEPSSRTSPAKGSPVKESPSKTSPVPKKASPAPKPKVQKSPSRKTQAPAKRTPTADAASAKRTPTTAPALAKRTSTTNPAPAKRAPTIGRGGSLKKAAILSKPLVSTTPKNTSNIQLSSPRAVALKRPAPSPTSGSGNNPLGGVNLVSPGAPIRLGLSKFARIKPLHGNIKT